MYPLPASIRAMFCQSRINTIQKTEKLTVQTDKLFVVSQITQEKRAFGK